MGLQVNCLTKSIQKIPPQVYLWVAVMIFGSSNAITRKITEIGVQHSIEGRNPISLCNVLFVGNLCAMSVLILLHKQELRRSIIRQISHWEWISLIAVAILAGGVSPALIFQALAIANVNNVILIGRLELPLTLALSVWLLGEKLNRWAMLGAIGSLAGIILTVILPSPQSHMMVSIGMLKLGWGEIFTAIAAIFLSLATVISKRRLNRIPLGLYSVVRTAIGTVVFFSLALSLYGSDHFIDAWSPFLWQWMLIYGVVIIVIGQSLWYKGLKNTHVSVSAFIASFVPVMGIIATYLILGEPPTQAHYIGGSVLLISIIVSQIGDLRTKKSVNAIVADEIGFKGI